MSDSKAASQIVVAVVIALLVGSSAPWWWKEVFPENSGPTPHPPPTATQPQTTLPPSGKSAGEQARKGCVVTITNPLVALMGEPSKFSQELVRIKPGEYTTSDYKVVRLVKDQGWFQIEAEGRNGWIANDTWTIASKTSACP